MRVTFRDLAPAATAARPLVTDDIVARYAADDGRQFSVRADLAYPYPEVHFRHWHPDDRSEFLRAVLPRELEADPRRRDQSLDLVRQFAAMPVRGDEDWTVVGCPSLEALEALLVEALAPARFESEQSRRALIERFGRDLDLGLANAFVTQLEGGYPSRREWDLSSVASKVRALSRGGFRRELISYLGQLARLSAPVLRHTASLISGLAGRGDILAVMLDQGAERMVEVVSARGVHLRATGPRGDLRIRRVGWISHKRAQARLHADLPRMLCLPSARTQAALLATPRSEGAFGSLDDGLQVWLDERSERRTSRTELPVLLSAAAWAGGHATWQTGHGMDGSRRDALRREINRWTQGDLEAAAIVDATRKVKLAKDFSRREQLDVEPVFVAWRDVLSDALDEIDRATRRATALQTLGFSNAFGDVNRKLEALLSTMRRIGDNLADVADLKSSFDSTGPSAWQIVPPQAEQEGPHRYLPMREPTQSALEAAAFGYADGWEEASVADALEREPGIRSRYAKLLKGPIPRLSEDEFGLLVGRLAGEGPVLVLRRTLRDGSTVRAVWNSPVWHLDVRASRRTDSIFVRGVTLHESRSKPGRVELVADPGVARISVGDEEMAIQLPNHDT